MHLRNALIFQHMGMFTIVDVWMINAFDHAYDEHELNGCLGC